MQSEYERIASQFRTSDLETTAVWVVNACDDFWRSILTVLNLVLSFSATLSCSFSFLVSLWSKKFVLLGTCKFVNFFFISHANFFRIDRLQIVMNQFHPTKLVPTHSRFVRTPVPCLVGRTRAFFSTKNVLSISKHGFIRAHHAAENWLTSVHLEQCAIITINTFDFFVLCQTNCSFCSSFVETHIQCSSHTQVFLLIGAVLWQVSKHLVVFFEMEKYSSSHFVISIIIRLNFRVVSCSSTISVFAE